MKIYTVHVHRQKRGAARDIALVREGFSWWAFLFSVLWAAWNRMWWVAVGLLVVQGVLSAVLYRLNIGSPADAIFGLGLAVIIGLIGNDLKRWSLGRRGFRSAGVVAADTVDAAALRFYDRHPEVVAEMTS